MSALSEEIQRDREIVFAAVKQRASALQYASEELRGDAYLQSWARLSKGKAMWRVVRGHARWLSPVAWWWLKTTVVNAHAEGGVGCKRDRQAYTSDFDP